MLGYVTVTGAGAADRLLAETAATLESRGLRLAGAVQQNLIAARIRIATWTCASWATGR